MAAPTNCIRINRAYSRCDPAEGIRQAARDGYAGLANDAEAVNQYAAVM